MAKDVSEVIMGALSPLAVKGAIKLVRGGSVDKVAGAVKAPGRAADDLASGGLGEKLGHTLKAAPAKLVKDAVSSVSPSGGPGGLVMGALKNALPFGAMMRSRQAMTSSASARVGECRFSRASRLRSRSRPLTTSGRSTTSGRGHAQGEADGLNAVRCTIDVASASAHE